MITEFLPHLVTAVYNWLFENDRKVFLHVAAEHPDFSMSPMGPESCFQMADVATPYGATTLKTIVLNIDPSAVGSFTMEDEFFFFDCRMNGTVTSISVPYKALLAMSCPNINLVHHFPMDIEWKFQPQKKEIQKPASEPVKQQEPERKPRREIPPWLKVVK